MASSKCRFRFARKARAETAAHPAIASVGSNGRLQVVSRSEELQEVGRR